MTTVALIIIGAVAIVGIVALAIANYTMDRAPNPVAPPIPLARPMNYRFSGWTGKDRKYEETPEPKQAKRVAKLLFADIWKGADPTKTPMYIYMPSATYRVIDRLGNVVKAEGEGGVRGIGVLG